MRVGSHLLCCRPRERRQGSVIHAFALGPLCQAALFLDGLGLGRLKVAATVQPG